MTLKGDAKFKRKLICGLKNDIRNLVNFHASSRKSENLHFDGLLFPNHIRVKQSLKKHWILVPKMTWGTWRNLIRAVANLKICTLMCYFCRKYIIFQPKEYRAVRCHNTEEWYKIWRGTDLCFEKWQEEFDEFWPNTWKSQNLHFNGLLWTRVYNDWAKKLHRNYVSWQWKAMQYLKKNWLVVWKMTRTLVNFHTSSRKSENVHFDGLVLSKAYKVLDVKVQKSYVSWHECSKEKLILEKYAFFVWCNRLEAVSGRYS